MNRTPAQQLALVIAQSASDVFEVRSYRRDGQPSKAESIVGFMREAREEHRAAGELDAVGVYDRALATL